ncbi:MAG: DegT/DnrJ/EryC1/StrS family aminotransferase [Candidatus Aenigmarchaeota archaeon]|nr:DegT/DnrJ/EryC1/StrS family aminotransferase [Candidatus Aenigmarchaeota archaeon]
MIQLFRPIITKEMEEAAIHALQNERLVLGESVSKFEELFARYCGAEHAVSTSSGTNALELALKSLDVQSKEIITCPSSFIASSNAIIHAGAKPVFVDSDGEAYNIDADRIEEKITGKTKAILPIHIYGTPCEMDRINEIAGRNGLFVVEDACQAHGATYKGRKAGSLGTVGCFSFYSTKNLTVGGDGGMIVTNDKKIADMAAKLRNCGRIGQYEHDVLGYTSRLNTVNAAIGIVQLKHLDRWNEARHSLASVYFRELKELEGFALPKIPPYIKSSFHLFACRAKDRNGLAGYLEKKEIQTSSHYPIPIHLQPIYRKLFNYREGDYPAAERLSKEVICLPIHPQLKTEEVKYISESVRSFCNG